jgi:hypothetical protein
MNTIKNLKDLSFSDSDYDFQMELTKKLDGVAGKRFDQEIINEIILWKVNRYAELDNKTLVLLNSIDSEGSKLNQDLTAEILGNLLNTKGIRLPIASTILRFKNPNIYQIIDQRAYRFLYGEELSLPAPTKNNIDSQIRLYIQYLQDLKEVPAKTGWDFSMLDRILYFKDIQLNSGLKIKY